MARKQPSQTGRPTFGSRVSVQTPEASLSKLRLKFDSDKITYSYYQRRDLMNDSTKKGKKEKMRRRRVGNRETYPFPTVLRSSKEKHF